MQFNYVEGNVASIRVGKEGTKVDMLRGEENGTQCFVTIASHDYVNGEEVTYFPSFSVWVPKNVRIYKGMLLGVHFVMRNYVGADGKMKMGYNGYKLEINQHSKNSVSGDFSNYMTNPMEAPAAQTEAVQETSDGFQNVYEGVYQ